MRHMACVVRLTLLSFLLAISCWASITGSISGLVSDPSGAVVGGATVIATNTQTGVQTTLKSDAKGFYNFPALQIGTYTVEVQQPGFKTQKQTGLVIDANSALRADFALQVGQIHEEVTISSDAVHVETESTQNGEVIESSKITAVPLNGRSYTDLLSLQPGVVPSAYGNQAPDIQDRPASGNLNPGNQSVNGQRETSNGFMVNGANVEEGKNNGAAVIPNLDSIAEFRIITNNFDAEYGNYSGGQVNVVTKSGTNTLHGSAFEFLRNTDLDAKDYFASARGVFIQNQFGGTLGGPIKRDKLFLFVDYQGTRQIQAPTDSIPVPSSLNRTGDLSDQADSLTGVVNGSFFAGVLSSRLGYPVNDGEAYFFPGCTATDPSNPCVFPNAFIPPTAWSAPSTNILPFIPPPNSGGAFNFVSSAFAQRLRADKGGIRVDGNSRFGMLSAYYLVDDYFLDDPYPGGGLGFAAPGFDGITPGRAQLIALSDNKVLGSTAVNQFQLSYTRSSATFAAPKGGLGHTLTSLRFTAPATVGGVFNGGIGPIDPKLEGVPNIALNSFAIGVPADTNNQINNTYQVQDNFSKVVGTHTLKFGGQFHYDQIDERNFFGQNGAFTFDGSETGSDFADFLIGAPTADGGFIQASRQVLDSRTKYFGIYLQDSWRARSSLTLNYGLRYEISQPWYDAQNKIETIVPGEQSVVFPNAPKGWLVPGDPGVPRTLAPTKYNAFSPRIGLAYSPNGGSGWIGKLTGGPAKTSIRAGFGIFYTAIEDLTQFQEVGDPPYGLFWVSPQAPLFESPYIDRANGFDRGQHFPFVPPPPNVSAKNPNTSFDWSLVEPISAGVAFNTKNRLPYGEHYDLSLQRQFGSNTVLTASYVGTQGHRLLTFIEANPGNQGLCLFLSNPANLDPSSPSSCGPGSEDPGVGAPIVLASGVSAPGYPGVTQFATTRLLTGLDSPTNAPFADNPYEKTVANSAYHSLQMSIRHTSSRASFLAGYTYGKCMDNSSGLEERTNVFNPRASRALCIFDVTHNFVVSYSLRLPFERLFNASKGWANKVVGGWELSGITTFATGLPVTLRENDDHSLTAARGVDLPVLVGGRKILNNTNPRSGQPYFNSFDPSAGGTFRKENIGEIGNVHRRFFHGPGLNNFDMALQKNFSFTESKVLQFRAEAFNVFNHAQFMNPDGNIRDDFPDNGGTFGLVSASQHARIMQVALKFLF